MALAVGQCPSASGFENEAMSNVAIKSYNRIAIETLLRESSSLESQLPCRTATCCRLQAILFTISTTTLIAVLASAWGSFTFGYTNNAIAGTLA